MKVRIKKFAPLQAGKMLAALYGLIGLIVAPVLVVAAFIAPKENGVPLVFAVVFPLIYIVVGFLAGLIGAFLYNLISRFVGGIEMAFEVET